MNLYERRDRSNLLETEFLPQLEAGGIGVVGVAVYIEDSYLPEMGLRVGLNQIARVHEEVQQSSRFAVCRTYDEILRARESGRIVLLITMEGVEPLGTDLNLLRVFYELGVRVIGLTHARRNAAGDGGAFARNGSTAAGLTAFGREVVRKCEALGIVIDLAHINPAGFDDVLEITTKPVIVSHTNARRYYDIERNISDEQIKRVGQRGGVIGINSVLVAPCKEDATIDRYVDHIEHVRDLIGINGVAIGFDFFHFIYRQWPAIVREQFHNKYANFHFIPDLLDHSHARAVTRTLIERGFADEEIEKILFGNWMRSFKQLL
ncbi:MAG: hypothetical protein JWO45_1677 [Spartobacteria bacterium]|nr:hypothetical protein [Spartobacteria bacterium]